VPNVQGAVLRLDDDLLDAMIRNQAIMRLIPHCARVAESNKATQGGCGRCKRKAVRETLTPVGRRGVRDCLIRQPPETVEQIKALLGVTTLIVYTKNPKPTRHEL